MGSQYAPHVGPTYGLIHWCLHYTIAHFACKTLAQSFEKVGELIEGGEEAGILHDCDSEGSLINPHPANVENMVSS